MPAPYGGGKPLELDRKVHTRATFGSVVLGGSFRKRGGSVGALLLALAACQGRSPTAAAAGAAGSASAPAVVGATPAAPVVGVLASCAGVGPASCPVAPGSAADLCAATGGCVKDASGYVDLGGLGVDCRKAPFNGPADTAFSAFQPAPVASGVRATSVVNLVASEDMTMRYGASYLVAQLDTGLCLVDELLAWDKSYSSTEFATRWSGGGERPRLLVQAQRSIYLILGQEELSSGESNVESEECAHVEYEVVGGRFARVGQSSTPGLCEDEGAP